MARIGRPKARSGYAQPGELTCKRNWDEDGRTIVCGNPVPEGELTHIALNSRAGARLALCADCRTELEEEFLYWYAAQVPGERLLSDLLDYPNKGLVSHSELRRVLIEHGAGGDRPGPLTREDQLRAVELRDGPEVRRWVEKHG